MHPKSSNLCRRLIQLITVSCGIACALALGTLIYTSLGTASAFTYTTQPINVALAANGGVASASSTLACCGWNFAPAGANNGNRSGAGWGSGEGWNDNPPANTFPDWLQIDFNGSKTIAEIDVFTGQDNWQNPSEPTEAMTFSVYGLTGYDVQYWNGSSWTTIPGGHVTGNNKVWRKFTFAPVTTTKIRVLANASVDGYSRITELEAWTAVETQRSNFALASAGGVATASSTLSTSPWNFTPAGANNGNRSGAGWGSGEGWNDNSPANTFPDWLQIDFNGSKTIDEIDVFTVQDNWQNPSEPTEAMTLSVYGLTGYDVQYWNGGSWTIIPGGSVTGNNKVWRKFTFVPVTTTKIRVLTNASVDGYSRITELEAYGPGCSACEAIPRLDPMNQTGGRGENPLSRNFNWTLPLVTLPGRAGMDLNLSLSYNSLVWTKTGSYISFDDDHGFPSPGFRLGFPVIQPPYFNAEVGKDAFMLISADGSRTELRRVGSSALYEAADSSYLLLDSTTMTLRATDGSQLKYELKGSEYQCTEIKDRNGNFITVNYTPSGRIDTIIDTLSRSIKFTYDGNGYLTSITQIWNEEAQNQTTHNWAVLEYANTTIQTAFTGLTVSGPSNGLSIKTLSKVTLADGSHYDFSYTSWGQVWKVSSFAADNHLLNYRSYNLPQDAAAAQTDCPRFTERRDWAENWNQNSSGVEQEVTTTYAVPVSGDWTMPDNSPAQPGMRADVTSPDGTVNKIYFLGTPGPGSGWRRGLPALVETYSGGNWQRKVMTTWTQDDISLAYPSNPRVTETNVYDPARNRARVQMTYQQLTFANGTSCQLPRDVYEYAANATTILRSTRTDYHTNTAYSDRRIIGLVTEKRLYEGDVNNSGVLMSKIGFFYDNENSASSIQGNDAPVQHDNTNYSESFVTGRANLSSVRQYDATNTAQFTTDRIQYNTAGAVTLRRDPLNHEVQISYGDAFSDNNPRNTLAFPTSFTDPDGYTATTKYHFDFGALTFEQMPNPTPSQPGPERVFSYDVIGRLTQITNQANGSYSRYVYATSQNRLETYATFQAGLGEAYSFKLTDGAGRIIAVANELPGSYGGYSGQKFVYDVMGRLSKTSNPAETGAIGMPLQWTTTGDDATVGWVYKQQTYDWKGRPLITTNADGTTTQTISYSGCGCAGGEVITLTDEGTLDGGVAKRRQQKIYSDVLGRTNKTETLNWQGGSVYSATVKTYNALDEITQIRQYAGAEGSSTYQDTTMSYDGYGRLSSRHLPEQDTGTATVWTYNADDTINTVTDARGAITTFGYTGTGRHLVKSITHALTGNPTISATFEYDAVGNRTSMTDGLGTTSYTHNQLSQLTSETRTITGVGSFTLNYTYNLTGQLSSITDPFGAQVSYNYDKIGRLSAINGANFASVTSYAANLQYRAWGALKSLTYGNSKTLSLGYDVNLDVASYEIPGLIKKSYQYYADGQVKFTQDQLLTNSKFDRLYRYDQVGRVTTALSGAEARGQGPTNDRPYNETIGYDPLGHLNLRELRHWDRYDTTGVETYTNNRRFGWQYDPDGRLLSGNGYYTYDAAGQTSSFGDADPYTTDQQFDGDGKRIKSVQRSFDANTNEWTTDKVTYYIHSSVIGELISEVSAQGTKERSFVFAGNNVIAVQSIGVSPSQYVLWQHYDASGASYRSTNASGESIEAAEMDPMGADAGLMKPFTWQQPTGPGKLEPYYGIPELNSTNGCTLDRVPMPCEIFYSLLNNNAVQAEYLLPDVKKAPPKPSKKDQPKPPPPTGLTVIKRDVTSLGLGIFVFDSPTWNNEEGGWDWEEATVTIAGHEVDLNALKTKIGECVHDLYPQYEMVDFKGTTRPKGRGGRADDDKYNGTLTIKDVISGTQATIVNDPTPPPVIIENMRNNSVDAVGATDLRNPWWTFTVPEGSMLHEMRNAEKRYPELYLATGMDYVRIQLHESGAALSAIRAKYYPAMWARPSDNGLYPNGHPDDGPAMEDCVGRKYYQAKGLTPEKFADLK